MAMVDVHDVEQRKIGGSLQGSGQLGLQVVASRCSDEPVQCRAELQRWCRRLGRRLQHRQRHHGGDRLCNDVLLLPLLGPPLRLDVVCMLPPSGGCVVWGRLGARVGLLLAQLDHGERQTMGRAEGPCLWWIGT